MIRGPVQLRSRCRVKEELRAGSRGARWQSPNVHLPVLPREGARIWPWVPARARGRGCRGPLTPLLSPRRPSAAAGRPGRRGAARAGALGQPPFRSAPSGGAPAAARACAVGVAAVWAARAGGARERARPGLRVGRDGAVPLLRRRVRGVLARLRSGATAPAPAAARAAGAGARAALLSPDSLRRRGIFHGRAQPLPHGARAVGARVCLRVTLPHSAWQDGGALPAPPTVPTGQHGQSCKRLRMCRVHRRGRGTLAITVLR